MHVDGDVVNGMAAYQPVVLVCVLCGGRMKTQIILYQGQSINLSPLRRLIERRAQPLFVLKFDILDEGEITVLHSNAHTLTQNLITFLRHMLSDKNCHFAHQE
jgi:hypothetical protein